MPINVIHASLVTPLCLRTIKYWLPLSKYWLSLSKYWLSLSKYWLSLHSVSTLSKEICLTSSRRCPTTQSTHRPSYPYCLYPKMVKYEWLLHMKTAKHLLISVLGLLYATSSTCLYLFRKHLCEDIAWSHYGSWLICKHCLNNEQLAIMLV